VSNSDSGVSELAGRTAIVVEDEASVALLIEDMLLDLGCEVLASAAQLSRACALAETTTCDFAVLDVNLGGDFVFPAAEILRRRKIPFLFSTGYGRDGLPEAFKQHAIIGKPFAIEDLRAAILLTLARAKS
jgi:CheY-like chemotaxis protein